MFGLFGGSKNEIVDKPFSAFLGGLHFASNSLPPEPKVGVPMNLKGVLYIKGNQEIAVIQNNSVVQKQHELHIDRSTGLASDKIECT